MAPRRHIHATILVLWALLVPAACHARTLLQSNSSTSGLPICSNTPDVCGFPSSVTRLLRPPALPRLNVPGPGDLLSDDGLFALDKLVQAATGRSLSAGNPCRKIPIYSWDDATELSEACGNLPEVQDGSVPYIVGTLSRSIEVAGPTGIEEKEVGVCVAMRPCAPSRSYLFGLSGVEFEVPVGSGITLEVEPKSMGYFVDGSGSLTSSVEMVSLPRDFGGSSLPTIGSVNMRAHVSMAAGVSLGVEVSKKLEVEVEGDARLAINLDPNNNGVGGSDFAFMLDLNNAQPSIKYGEKVHGPNRDQPKFEIAGGLSGDASLYIVNSNADGTMVQLGANGRVDLLGLANGIRVKGRALNSEIGDFISSVASIRAQVTTAVTMGDAGFAAMMRGSMTLSLELPPKAAAEFDDFQRIMDAAKMPMPPLIQRIRQGWNVNVQGGVLVTADKDANVRVGLVKADNSIDFLPFCSVDQQCASDSMCLKGFCVPKVCWIRSYGRGVGSIPDACPPGHEKQGALCYPTCRDGYYGAGPVCWKRCNGDYTDIGALCWRNAHTYGKGCCCIRAFGRSRCCSNCREGYTDMGCTCTRHVHSYAKDSYGRGAGVPMVCRSGLVNQAGLCYQPCRAGYAGVGPVCWQNQVPASQYPAKCSDVVYGGSAAACRSVGSAVSATAGFRLCPTV